MNTSRGTHLHTFGDGSELHVCTTYSGEEEFACELFLSAPGRPGGSQSQLLPETVVAKTCREAQRLMYVRIQALYPAAARRIKAPPYLIACGPDGYVERARPGWHQRGSRGPTKRTGFSNGNRPGKRPPRQRSAGE